MNNLNVFCKIILALLLASCARADWSWGSNQKSIATSEIKTDDIIPENLPPANSQPVARSVEVPKTILPLEEQQEYYSPTETTENIADDEGRNARFLGGINDKLCKLGVKGLCEKSQYGYPPVSADQYGNIIGASSYDNYAPNVYGPPPSSPSHYPGANVVPQKPSKSLFGSLFKNKKSKGTLNGNYGVPPPPPSYDFPQPSYGAPQSVYKPPTKFVPQPAYQPPVPEYSAPKPHYQATQKISYKQPFQPFDTPKPKDVLIHKVQGQHSIPVADFHPSGVQHIHTHTHIYKPGPGIDIRDGFKVSRDDGNYEASSQVRTVKASVQNVAPYPSVGTNKVYIPQINNANGFTSQFKPSQEIPYISGISTNQDKRHISPTTSGFDSFGLKEKNFQTSIDKLTASFANNGLQRAYQEDCQCVPQQYCGPQDLVARSDTKEIRHLLDARNQNTEILSNSSIPEDYYDYDYIRTTDLNSTYEDVDFTTITPEVSTVNNPEETTEYTTNEPSITEALKNNTRVRRDTKEGETNSTLGLEGRQLNGFAPGLNGCGQDYVCCRRPVYVAAQRSAPICGKGNPSIHGRVASYEFEKGQSDFGEYPWQAAILRDEGPESMFVCGATLIDDRHVLTAAHCVTDLKVETLKVRLGEWDVNRDTEFYKYLEDRVSGVFIHPEFYKGNLYNDIAILRLANFVDIESYPHISPICLPAPNTDFTNYKCHVTGWGKDAFGDKGKFQHILKELEIQVVDHQTCEFALQGTRLGRDYKLHKGFICAGGEEGKDACKGDGGGPLVCATENKVFQLAGAVSWGIGCGQRGVPGVYVNIPYYADWIRSTTRV